MERLREGIRERTVPAGWLRPAALALTFALLGCAKNPVTGELEFTTLSTANEIEMGHDMALEVQRQVGMVDDPELGSYVAQLGASLAEHSPRQDVPYRFQIVDMVEPNAFALPGGYIYVSRGLLALTNSESELAGVVGHEIGHVAAKHVAQRETRKTGTGVLSAMSSVLGGAVAGSAGMQSFGGMADLYGAGIIASYGRDQERQADKIGQEIAGATGYDPGAMSAFLERMGRYAELLTGRAEQRGFLDSHPPTEERVQATAHRAKAVTVAERERLSQTRAAYLSKLIGLPLGNDPRHGVFVGQRFIHPVMGFAVDFPTGWQTVVKANLAAALAPGGQALIKLERQGGSRDPSRAATAFARANRLYLKDELPLTIGGLDAYHARAKTSSDAGPMVVDLTWIAHPQGLFRIASASPATAFAQYERAFAAVAQGFHRASDRERSAVVQRQLWIARARAGESLAALSQRTRNVWSVEETAVANSLDAADPLAADQMVKIAIDLPFRP